MVTRALSVLAVAAGSLVFAVASGATTPAVNGRIVYQDAGGFLYSAAPDGSDSQPFWTAGTSAVWSPDGTRIAYLHPGSDGLARLWVMNADGSGRQQLTPDDGTGFEALRLTWSPDGRTLAFTSTRGGGIGIWMVNADGSGLHQWSGPQGANPSWSPDGSRIAFERGGTAPGIVVANADGSGVQQLTLTGTDVSDGLPAWSPDGATIAFVRLNHLTGRTDLYAIDADGSALRQLTTVGDANNPSWSPDGAKLVFDRRCSAGCSPILYEINADGTEVAYLVRTPGTVLPLIGEIPSWGSSTVRPRTDVTAPTIDVQTPADGAVYDMGGAVTVAYTCSDDISGVASCTGALPNGATLDTSRPGTYAFQVTATDEAGNSDSRSLTYTVADRTPPTIAINTPADGEAYVLGTSVSADYRCADEPGGSGVRACTATPLDTSSVGSKTFTVTASDNAGNTASATRTYSVIYAFAGFYSPTSPYPAATSANAGQSVKLRFSLGGYQGLDVLAVPAVWTTCSGGDPIPANGTLAYQATLDRYAFEASTPKSWRGACKDLTVTLEDGTTHRARFQFD